MLFEPLKISRSLELPNRIVMAPMGTNAAEQDLTVSDHQIDYYRRRALGGAGLIIVEATMVSVKGVALTREREEAATRALAIHDEHYVPRLKDLAQAIKDAGARAGIQLNDSSFIARGIGPGDLSREELEDLIREFVAAGRRAAEAGFEVIEFHMAHRYTLADFLSKRANKRGDEYGGNIAGRCMVAESIVRGTKEVVGDRVAVSCRINGDEYQSGGNTLKDAKAIAKRLVQAGADMIHVSAGGRIEDGGDRSYSCFRQNPTQEFPDGVNVHLAESVKKVVSVPVVAVGKITTPELAEEILSAGKADLVALGRPLLADPDFPLKARQGRGSEIIRCLSCNDCLRLVFWDKVAECKRGELSLKKKKNKRKAAQGH